MTHTNLALGVALGLLTGLLYAYVGHILRDRTVRGQARYAHYGFIAWWYGIAAFTVLGSLDGAISIVREPSVAMVRTLTYVSVLTLTVALGGLLYYLLYLYTGRVGVAKPVVAVYSAVYVFFVYVVSWMNPVGVNRTAWQVNVAYEAPPSPGFQLTVVLVLLLPVILAAILYGSLFFRLRDRTKRYRVGLVSAAFILWFGVTLFGSVTGLSLHPWWPLASRVVGLLAPLIVVVAFRPPRWVRDWAGVQGIGEEARG